MHIDMEKDLEKNPETIKIFMVITLKDIMFYTT